MQSKLSAVSLCQPDPKEETNGGLPREEGKKGPEAVGIRKKGEALQFYRHPSTTILLKHRLILFIRSVASAAIQRVAICALISKTPNPDCRRLVGHGHNPPHLLGSVEIQLRGTGGTRRAPLYPSLLSASSPASWPQRKPVPVPPEGADLPSSHCRSKKWREKQILSSADG